MSKLKSTLIKELRTKENMTQQELADLVNVRRETIVRLEKGNYNPTLLLAADIANMFGKKIDEVFLIESQ